MVRQEPPGRNPFQLWCEAPARARQFHNSDLMRSVAHLRGQDRTCRSFSDPWSGILDRNATAHSWFSRQGLTGEHHAPVHSGSSRFRVPAGRSSRARPEPAAKRPECIRVPGPGRDRPRRHPTVRLRAGHASRLGLTHASACTCSGGQRLPQRSHLPNLVQMLTVYADQRLVYVDQRLNYRSANRSLVLVAGRGNRAAFRTF